MKRLLVTGLHGFVGTTLARQVSVDDEFPGWEILPIAVDLDLANDGEAQALVASAVPDAVIHLAALSSVAESFKDPAGTFRVNVIGTLRLLQALKAGGFSGRMLFVSSGDVYGQVAEARLPIDEDVAPNPRSPYAVSKVSAETMCRQWVWTEAMDIVIARPFNHIGPGQSPVFAIPDFARQIVEIAKGERAPVLRVGDVEVTRDFTDVRDVVRAYFALLDSGVPGEIYNVCSGTERTVREVLQRLIELAGVDVAVETDPSRLRKAEQRRVCGSSRKLRAATGWVPAESIDDSLSGLLQFWGGSVRYG